MISSQLPYRSEGANMEQTVTGPRAFGRALCAFLVSIALTFGFFSGFPMQAAGADDPEDLNENTSLYFGNGSQEWSLYTDEGLTTPYTEGRDVTWSATGNTLNLNGFKYITGKSAACGLVLPDESTLNLSGANSIHVAESSIDTFGIRTEGSATIQGDGNLTITTADSKHRTYGILLNQAMSVLTIDGATVTVKTGTCEFADGIYGKADARLAIKGGAQVSSAGYSPSQSGRGYGAFFASPTDPSENPLTIEGEFSFLSAQGSICAIKSDFEPSLGSAYGVWAARSFDASTGNTGWGVWNETHGYYEENQAYGTARYVKITEKPTILTTELDYAVVNEAYESNALLVRQSPTSESIFWATPYLREGPLAGFSISNWAGIITGTPTQVGTWPIQVFASDEYGTSSVTLSLPVYAAHPVKADAALNRIAAGANVSGSGTTEDPFSVKVGSTFTLTALGDREGADGVTPTDTRWTPSNWIEDSSAPRALASPYSISTAFSTEGIHTIEVTYLEEAWSGTAWAATGEVDVKTALIVAVADPDEGDSEDKDKEDGKDDGDKGEDGGTIDGEGGGPVDGGDAHDGSGTDNGENGDREGDGTGSRNAVNGSDAMRALGQTGDNASPVLIALAALIAGSLLGCATALKRRSQR